MRREHGELNGSSEIDRELRAALAVEPSPEFVTRVRMRIASDPEPTAWGYSWLLGAAGAVAVVILVAGFVFRGEEQPARRAADVTLPPVVARDFSPAIAKSVVAQDFTPAVAGVAVDRPATVARRQPEVLFSAAEMRGLRRLVALANQGDSGLEALLAPPADPAPIANIEPDEIVIAPITIEPLISDTQ